MLGNSTPLLGAQLGQLADPTAPVDPQDTTRQTITVAPGATAVDIGTDLQQRGLIRSALAFRLAAEQAGVGSNLAAGDYELSRSMSTNDIIQVLAKGEVKRGLLATIPEGWRSEQIADRLESTGFASRDDFLRAVAEPAFRAGRRAAGDDAASSAGGLPVSRDVRGAAKGLRAEGGGAHGANVQPARGQPPACASQMTKLTPSQVLTLASIVEREAKQASERPLIASVYLNRLAANLPLQADPTVQYAVANRDGAAASAYNYWKQELTPADLQIDSPFNTYVIPGLAARADLQPGRGLDSGGPAARPDRLCLLRRNHRRQRNPPVCTHA